MEQDERTLERILRDFSRTLAGAISNSPQLEQSLRRIHNEGYCLQITVNCARREPLPEPVSVRPHGFNGPSEPSFRIDASDLSFLKSIGIDPTRRLRRRRN